MASGSSESVLGRLRDSVARSALRLYMVSVLVAILPIGLFTYYADQLLRQETEQQAVQSNLQIASLSALFIDDHFHQTMGFLQSYATAPKFQHEWASNNLTWIQDEMNLAHELQPDTAQVSTYTLDGTLNTISPLEPEVIGNNYASSDWYKGVTREWKPYVSEVQHTAATPYLLAVVVSVPIKDATGKPTGILVAAYSLEQVSRWLLRVNSYGARTISVVDQSGHLLTRPSIDVTKPPLDLSGYEPVKRLLQGAAGSGVFRRGTNDLYVAYIPIPGMHWGVFSEEPTSIVQERTLDVRRHAAVFALFFLALAVVGGILVSSLSRSHQSLARSYQSLSYSEANYRSLIQGATYGIYRSDEKGFVAVNPALLKMLGYKTESEVLHLDMGREVYWDEKEHERIAESSGSQLQSGGMQAIWKRKDGTPITVRISGRMLRNSKGQPINFEGIVEDVSSRHLLEEQLRHSEKLAALGRLVTGAAHEINNPLAAIMGYAELLTHDPAATPEQRTFAEKIRQQARRTKVITANLQSFSSQAPAEKKHLLDLNSIAANAVRIAGLNSALQKIEFKQELDPDLPLVLGDEYQLLEVCMHIVNNAVDALKEVGGGVIQVRSWCEAGQIALEFNDNGPGMEDVSRVFDPFYTTKPIGEGVGLGLSACYGIIREHGGVIQCSNRAEGGATVVVRLPVSEKQSASGAIPVTSAAQD